MTIPTSGKSSLPYTHNAHFRSVDSAASSFLRSGLLKLVAIIKTIEGTSFALQRVKHLEKKS
jgi:hypothetical protein